MWGDLMKSILDGCSEIKNLALFHGEQQVKCARNVAQRTELIRLCRQPPDVDGAALADRLLDKVRTNWRSGREARGKPPSRENWRFRPVGTISRLNTSPEVTFERNFIATTNGDWANQVPTASGILGTHTDKRRAIDLVRRCGNGVFEFIELKLGSDTPLYAGLELLEYGVLYAFARVEAEALQYGQGFSEILDADAIRLRVLAPAAYYRYATRNGTVHQYDLSWLDRLLNAATARLAARVEPGLQMDFAFEAFPDDFTWPAKRDAGPYAASMMAQRAAHSPLD